MAEAHEKRFVTATQYFVKMVMYVLKESLFTHHIIVNSRGLPHDKILDEKSIKLAIWNSMKSLYGIVGGAALEFNLIHKNRNVCILQTSSEYVAIRGISILSSSSHRNISQLKTAIVYVTDLQGELCKFEIAKVSNSLFSLSTDRFPMTPF